VQHKGKRVKQMHYCEKLRKNIKRTYTEN